MQAASDILLGWTRADGPDGISRDYYVRQLWDGKGSALIEDHEARSHAGVCGSVRLDAGTRARPFR